MLDKTGTVTTGAMTLTSVTPADGGTEDDLLHLAGSLQHGSEHPIARAVADAATLRRPLAQVTDFASTEGLGVEGIVEGRRVVVGRPNFLAAQARSRCRLAC